LPGGEIVEAGRGRTDTGAPIVARLQNRPLAVGIGREASWGPLWLVVRHSMECRLRVTPILDRRVLTALAVERVLAAPEGGEPVGEVVQVHLSQPSGGFSRQALRGVWFAVRVELEALEDGDVLAAGGFELEARPLGWAAGAINAGE